LKTTTSPSPQYAPLTIHLHWLMFALFVGVFASIELRVLFAKGTDIREAFKATHFMLGLLVLGLGLLRLVVRLRHRAPPIVPPPGVWQHRAAVVMHGVLYAWFLCMPVAGWLLLSAEGKPIPFFGMELMPLLGKDKATASTIKHWHETAGQAGYWLIGAHAAVALLHHFVKHDNVLVRMLPRLARSGS
jgi:superoxide oxidase